MGCVLPKEVVSVRTPRAAGRAARQARLAPELLTIGVDIGGTKIAAGVVTVEGTVLDTARRDTPDLSGSAAVVEAAILDAVSELTRRHRVHAVGIAAAGFVDAERRTVLFAPHLSWRNEPLRDALYRRLRLPVVVENDANASAWGEHRFGAGRGEPQLLVVNLGTGIGGAYVRSEEHTSELQSPVHLV